MLRRRALALAAVMVVAGAVGCHGQPHPGQITVTVLPTAAGPDDESYAADINEVGQVAGDVQAPGVGLRAVTWDGGTVTDVTPEVPVPAAATATAVSPGGTVVGRMTIGSFVPVTKAFVSVGDERTFLPPGGDNPSVTFPQAINARQSTTVGRSQ